MSTPQGDDRQLGRLGWVLVGAVFLSFLVIPGLIYLTAAGATDVPFRVAYLALPMLPAIALGTLAVYTAVR